MITSTQIKTFEEKKLLGRIFLLPTDIESKVLLRYRLQYSFITGTNEHTISVVCALLPKERNIHIETTPITIKISTPPLIFQTDILLLNKKFRSDLLFLDENNQLPFLDENSPVPTCSIRGYLFKKENEDTTLTESLKTVHQYFFPHIYDSNGYMCVHGTITSPRQLNSLFWGSSFRSEWYEYARTHMKKSDLILSIPVDTYASYENNYLSYNDYQNTSSHKLSSNNREFLEKYTNLFELNEKPTGIFISTDQDVCNISSIKEHLCAGFAFFHDGEYFIYMKDDTFLNLHSDQVAIQ